MGLRGAARTVAAGFEKLVEHVVFVGGDNQTAYRQAHLFGDVSGADVAEIAAGHAEADGFAVVLRGLEIAGEVVHHLRDDAPPVDGIDRADVVLRFKRGIVLHGFNDVLTVVKHTLHGDIVDVCILQAVHLRALERAHFALGRKHEDIDAFFTAQRVFGGRAGVAAGCAQNIERFALFV